MGRWTDRATRAFLSDHFVAKLKNYGFTSYLGVPPEYKISLPQFTGWLSGVNKAPKDHEGLMRLAAKVGVEKGKMFL